MSDQNFLFFLQDTFHAITTALKSTAPLYVFHASKTQREFQNAMEENGIEIISQLIWNKPSINHIGAAYKSKHEPFFYARMKGADIPWYGSELFEETVRTLPSRAEKSDKEILQMIKKVKEAEKEGLTTIRTQKTPSSSRLRTSYTEASRIGRACNPQFEQRMRSCPRAICW